MFKFTIKELKVSKLGVSIKFNAPYSRVWAIVPGALQKRSNKQNQSTLVIPGEYDPAKVLTRLKKLPVIDPKAVEVDFDTIFPVYRTLTYKKKGYSHLSNRKLPHKQRVAKKEPFVAEMLFTSRPV